MGRYTERAENRDYSIWWQIEGAFPSIVQKPKPAIPSGRPIPTYENYIRCVKGQKPLWMPEFFYEQNMVWPDTVEEHPVPEVDGLDWWGTQWSLTANGMAVAPDTRVLSDFSKWKEELEIPDYSKVDFSADGKKIMTAYDPDRVHLYEAPEGLFERLHALIPFEEALLAFYDEPELLQEYFSMMVDYKVGTSRKVFENYGRVDGIIYHDDWGTQRSGFFSNEMFREQMVPQTKRLVKEIKEMGKIVVLHSCGRNMEYVPYMIEMGFDMWAPQHTINDSDYLYTNFNKEISFAFAVPIDHDMNESQVRDAVRTFVDKYGENGRVLAWIRGDSCSREMGAIAREELYNYSLEYYSRLWK